MPLNRLLLLGNMQSIQNKMDKLQGNARFLKDYKDCCVIVFIETWLTERNQDSDLMISGFGAPHHLDRNSEVTNKLKEEVYVLILTKGTALW